jgi:excisionase family DNA binding protein
MTTVSTEAATRRWFDVKTGADYCGVKTKTIRRAITDGKLPRARLGRKFVFDKKDLDSWILGEMVRVEA